jgi:hypothetical protein
MAQHTDRTMGQIEALQMQTPSSTLIRRRSAKSSERTRTAAHGTARNHTTAHTGNVGSNDSGAQPLSCWAVVMPCPRPNPAGLA